MKSHLSCLFLLLLIKSSLTQVVDIKCEFKTKDSIIFTCLVNANPNITKPSSVIQSIDAPNLQNVKGFQAENLTINYIPKNLQDKLPSLTDLIIKNCSLQKITKDVFINMTNLKLLNLAKNNLQSIPPKVFITNLNLEVIKLNKNQLTSIPPAAFIHLKKLWILEMYNNTCVAKFNHRNNSIFEALNCLHTCGFTDTKCMKQLDQKPHPDNNNVIIVTLVLIVMSQVLLTIGCFICIYRYAKRSSVQKDDKEQLEHRSEYYAKTLLDANAFASMGFNNESFQCDDVPMRQFQKEDGTYENLSEIYKDPNYCGSSVSYEEIEEDFNYGVVRMESIKEDENEYVNVEEMKDLPVYSMPDLSKKSGKR